MTQREEMVSEFRVLDYLKKEGPSNTFRIASDLEMDRGHVLEIIKKLEEKGALTVKGGIIYFIEYPPEEKEIPELKVIQAELKLRNAKPKILMTLQSENKQLKAKLTKLREALEEFKKKANTSPKIITKTIIRKVPVTKTVVKKVLTVVKKVFVPNHKKQKRIRAKIKISQKKKKKTKITVKNKKFKFPKFKLMEKIKKFKKPAFLKLGGRKKRK